MKLIQRILRLPCPATLICGLAAIGVLDREERAAAFSVGLLSASSVSGQQAPGAPAGAMFADFGLDQYAAPALNSMGQIAFRASLAHGSGGVDAANDRGVWSDGSGSLAQVAGRGMHAPGAPAGAVFSNFADPVLNDAGDVALHAYLLQGAGGVDAFNDDGIWAHRGGALGLVARSGGDAPDIPGAKFYRFSDPTFNHAGQIAFHAGLLQGVGGVDGSNDGGIWAEEGGSLRLVMRAGDPAPGAPAGFTYAGPYQPYMNSNGQVAFISFMRNGGLLGTDIGVWIERGGSPELIVRSGMQAPGLDPGATFAGLYTGPTINSSGRVAIAAYLNTGSGGINASNSSGVWSDRFGTLELVALAGSQAPDAPLGAKFSHFPEVRMDDAGRIAVVAGLKAFAGGDVDEENDSGIWVEQGGSLRLLAREGSQAPGTPPGAVFDSFTTGLSGPALNSAGRSAFMAGLQPGFGGVTDANDLGIWAQDFAGALTLIVREGDLIDVSGGAGLDWRTVSTLFFLSAGSGDDGWRTSFNDRNEVAYYATFTDGSSGAFVSQLAAVPEAASLWLAAVGGVGAFARRRRLAAASWA